jgi:hypothetical protein
MAPVWECEAAPALVGRVRAAPGPLPEEGRLRPERTETMFAGLPQEIFWDKVA